MEDKSVHSGVAQAGEAVGEGVRNATSATAVATGQAERAVGEAGESCSANRSAGLVPGN
jgi:hypothetical protein